MTARDVSVGLLNGYMKKSGCHAVNTRAETCNFGFVALRGGGWWERNRGGVARVGGQTVVHSKIIIFLAMSQLSVQLSSESKALDVCLFFVVVIVVFVVITT